MKNETAVSSRMQMKTEMVIPERIQIEGVYGCNAWCNMCPVHAPSERKQGTMSLEKFKYIVDEMAPYAEKITKLDFWGLGESVMDRYLSEKVRYAKEKGFTNLAIATNVDLLTKEISVKLFEAGIDTIIFSIDGATKETQESIRVKTDFDRVVGNAEKAIAARNKGNYKTKFIFRFIRQAINRAEWEDFRAYWGSRISKEKGDATIGYDAHSWGGEIDGIVETTNAVKVPESVPCHHVFDRLVVLSDGTIPLCCSDLHHAEYAYGNIDDASPIEVFNSDIARRTREIHLSGKRNDMEICANCTILDSEASQEVE